MSAMTASASHASHASQSYVSEPNQTSTVDAAVTEASASTSTFTSTSAFRNTLHRWRLHTPSRDNATSNTRRVFPPVPRTPQDRLEASLTELPFDVTMATKADIRAAEEKGKTVLYLAYGSNLCNETFRGVRGIRPLSQTNVQVPSLRLTFDLAGIPYTEPCFANSARRDPEAGDDREGGDVEGEDYHKDRWHKDMVGCVYEVTPSDYAHIIATEGGGSSYEDILVPCHPLSDSDTVPLHPATQPFMAHTLFAPVQSARGDRYARRVGGHFSRPDPSYAQPSVRYLKLITDGARELGLPAEYQAYLAQLRPYVITTLRQAVGQKLFMGVYAPILFFLFGLQKKLQDDKGRNPKWLAVLMGWFFVAMWASYDVVWKRAFGDGERTEGQGEDGEVGEDGQKEILVGSGSCV
jgi:hypothetical protein